MTVGHWHCTIMDGSTGVTVRESVTGGKMKTGPQESVDSWCMNIQYLSISLCNNKSVNIVNWGYKWIKVLFSMNLIKMEFCIKGFGFFCEYLTAKHNPNCYFLIEWNKNQHQTHRNNRIWLKMLKMWKKKLKRNKSKFRFYQNHP